MGVWGQLCQQYHLFNGCLYRPSQVIHCPSELYLSDQCAWIRDGAKLLPNSSLKPSQSMSRKFLRLPFGFSGTTKSRVVSISTWSVPGPLHPGSVSHIKTNFSVFAVANMLL